MAVANQYVFEINKDSTEGKNHYRIEEENFYNALLNIKTVGALKLFLFLSRNKDGFTWHLYRDIFMNATGLNTNTVTNAIKELKELGYVVPISEKGYHCSFFDNIDKGKQAKREREEKFAVTEENEINGEEFVF